MTESNKAIEAQKLQKGRNFAIASAVGIFVLIVFLVTIVKLAAAK